MTVVFDFARQGTGGLFFARAIAWMTGFELNGSDFCRVQPQYKYNSRILQLLIFFTFLSTISENIHKFGGTIRRSLLHVPNGILCTRVQKVVTMPTGSPMGRITGPLISWGETVAGTRERLRRDFLSLLGGWGGGKQPQASPWLDIW